MGGWVGGVGGWVGGGGLRWSEFPTNADQPTFSFRSTFPTTFLFRRKTNIGSCHWGACGLATLYEAILAKHECVASCAKRSPHKRAHAHFSPLDGAMVDRKAGTRRAAVCTRRAAVWPGHEGSNGCGRVPKVASHPPKRI
jgi:hypothetical protein